MQGKTNISESLPDSPDFRLLFESTPGSYLVLNPEFKIVAVSDAYLRATMTEREKILDRHLFDVFPDNPNDPDATGVGNLRASLNRVLMNKTPDTMAVQKYDIRRPGPGGEFEERFWSPINSPVLNNNKDLIYIIHRVEDVTEFIRLRQQKVEQNKDTEVLRTHIRNMESEIFLRAQELQTSNENLRGANEKLEKSEKELKAEILQRKEAQEAILKKKVELAKAKAELDQLELFAYVATHDLREPLHKIISFSDLLKKTVETRLNSDEKDYLSRIQSGALRLAHMIEELRELSKINTDPKPFVRVDLASIVQEAVSDLELRVSEAKAEVEILELPSIYGDRMQLRQVFQNLIGNALKFRRKNQDLKIRVGSQAGDSDFIEIYVEDNGIGFDEKYLDRIFKPFQRLHSSSEYEGSGIGLTICHKIILRHGGKISARSSPGKGSKFILNLPLSFEGGII